MFKKTSKKIVAVLLMLCMVFAFSGCAKEESSADAPVTKIDEIKKAGKLVLGTAADYPPYEFHKEIDGEDTIVGFDIEIAKEIAKDLGVELEVKDMKFDGLLAALVADKIDIIVAGMVPTEERAKSVDFSKQYYTAEQSILIRAEDKDKFKTKEDFKGAKVGAQKSTIQEDIANSIEGAEVKLISKITDLVLDLTNDKVDAIVLVNPVASAYAKSNPDLYVPEISFGTEEGIATAVNKGNEELVEAINNTLDKLMKEDKINQFISDATALTEQE
ncbi:transporter substrate-binding domain-containing protein [Marinisporobacter balticus]|uniref:Amino acid ABC transporter substrate-binding protein (PAAT family) n=1 Tax=Marinisporobacter balticus TaxID=2018667 RepID=A0A4R2KPM2_9FIRM|nr:transporter substrate-binding domain-containing protein [Marinisporobacter balticus]TCO74587.1 amino acid ABC transporter substrate-binding protein (PAAT family) [Marinisporobacter balticus]